MPNASLKTVSNIQGGETVSTGLVRVKGCRWSVNLLKNVANITADNNEAELALAA